MLNSLLSWRPETWIDYLLLYIAPGIFMGAYLLVKGFQDRPSDFAKGLMKVMGKEITLVDQLKECGVYCFALVCVLIGWPGFLIWFIKDKKDEVARQEWQAQPDFECAPEYLIAKVDPVDAEITSYVSDPLSKVPAVPFGHLNKAWGNFLSNMLDEEDELWSFHIPKGSKTGKYQRECKSEIRGFAKVQDGKILAEFITEGN
ncbi:hypothetical protein [Polynucleobacter sp. JS-JIR-II-50]|uniref:hypothetical protein n=1 Tax=Polynucleobacter sp. JS-JIR-II-50 TaxID=2576919 RepID=UPI001BFEA1CF|nr:hypothetical protein [Polynucleobacter sp. JS-JIR-II-50]QWE05354.1 hypothetical protein FD963_04805 [Polynucleobacter sp. JS-JIR-II-50]